MLGLADRSRDSSALHPTSRGRRHAGHTVIVRRESNHAFILSAVAPSVGRTSAFYRMPAERGDHVTAYDQVKVWEIDEVQAQPRPLRPARPPRPLRPRRPAGTADRPVRSENAREKAERRRRAERNERLWVWARLSVAVILGAAVNWWPYGRNCGFGLAAYVAATAMIIVAGIWVVVCTWTCRMARTHAFAMLVTLWGVGLIGVEVLPRIGYAARPAAWLCGDASRGTP